MKTKTKDLNERVAMALGAVELEYPTGNNWELPDGRLISLEKNNFKNDLNAWHKYVWPELIELLWERKHCLTKIGKVAPASHGTIGRLLREAFHSPNPAKYLSEAFLKLKGESCQNNG